MESVARERESDVDATERTLGDDELTEPFTYAYIRTLFRESLKYNWPRYELEVPDDAGGVRRFLVCCPVFCQKGMAGRGTRGYVAYDLTTERFTWLKDAWRADYDGVEREGDILRKLNSNKEKIRNVPTLICHGDIRSQVTETPNFWEDRRNKFAVPPIPPHPNSSPSKVPGSPSCSLKRKHEGDGTEATFNSPHRLHRHYRLVVEEVCMPLHVFTDGPQLLSIVQDCMTGKHRNIRPHIHEPCLTSRLLQLTVMRGSFCT